MKKELENFVADKTHPINNRSEITASNNRKSVISSCILIVFSDLLEYAESLKNDKYGFRTRQICDFFISTFRRMRAENILNISQSHYLSAFSESATSQICVAISKKDK